MREVRLRPEAARDVEKIADYTIAHWGQEQAQAYVAALRRKAESLAETGFQQSPRFNIVPGLRRARSGNHLIYFMIEDHLIDVVRVLHQSADVEAAFGEDRTG